MINLLPANPTPLEIAWISVTLTAAGVLTTSLGRAVWRVRSCWKKRVIAEYLAFRQFGMGRENLDRRTALARRLLSNMSATPRNRTILS